METPETVSRHLLPPSVNNEFLFCKSCFPVYAASDSRFTARFQTMKVTCYFGSPDALSWANVLIRVHRPHASKGWPLFEVSCWSVMHCSVENNAQNRSQSMLIYTLSLCTKHWAHQGAPIKRALPDAIRITRPKFRVFPLKLFRVISRYVLPNFPKEPLS